MKISCNLDQNVYCPVSCFWYVCDLEVLKPSCSIVISVNSIEKLGHIRKLWITEMTSLPYVPKWWYVENESILFIGQTSAFNSECKSDKYISLFFNSRSCSFSDSSNQIHPYQLYYKSEVHDPSTKQIYCKHKAFIFCVCVFSKLFKFVLNHVWHLLLACLISSSGSCNLLNNLSLCAFLKILDYLWIQIFIQFHSFCKTNNPN